MEVRTAAPTSLDRIRDIDLTMAKASSARRESVEAHWRRRLGMAVARCFELAGHIDTDRACDLLKRPSAQIEAWQSGTERPLFDAIFAVDELRLALVLALSELAEPDGVQIEHVITVPGKRRA